MITQNPSLIENGTLAALEVGQSAKIVAIEAPRPLKRRLMDMGLTKGVTVKVLKVAPLGDPIEIQIRGYHLCLRQNEAAKVAIMKEQACRP